jgi:ATP-binding cassette subfamily B protein
MGENRIMGDRAALRWLLTFTRKRWRGVALVLGLSVLATVLALLQPWLTKILIDEGLIARRFDVVIRISAVLLGLGLLSLVLGAWTRKLYVSLSGDILFALREAVYCHLQRLSPLFYATRDSGDIMTRLDGDIAEIQRFSTDSLFALVSAVLGLMGSLFFLMLLNWKLGLLAFVLLPGQIVYLRFMRPRVERLTRNMRERTGAITGFFMETLPAMKFVQSMAAEEREGARLHALNRRFLGDLISLQMTSYFTGAVPGFMTTISTAIVFMAGGYLVISGAMTLGALIAFSVYLSRATGPVQTFLGLYVAYQRARVSLARVAELMAERPAVEESLDARDLPVDARGEIRLENISFAFPGRAGPVLKEASAAFPAGIKIGIRGASGVGKSTLIDLLQRLYDPDEGRILLAGGDIKGLKLAALRRGIAVVAQDITLFRGSVADNIRYANPKATVAEVEAAAQGAGIDDFIKGLPQGYATEVGTLGRALSGGQRQRIAVARAILQNPLVLVLDEATSAVDSDTEGRIVSAIDALFAGRTRILISHRADVIAGCDKVFDLKGGKLREVAGAVS